MSFDYTKGSLLIEFNSASREPTLEEFKHEFGLADHEVDEDYGLLSVDESLRHDGPNALIRRTWMATVSEEAGNRIEQAGHKNLIAVYTNYGRSNPPEP